MDRRSNAEVIIEVLAPAGKHVVEVGCGDGAMARLLARNGATVLGVECSPRQLAKARAGKQVAAVEIVEGVGQSLPAGDASADAVVFFNSLHHIPGEVLDQALGEAARVLKPGGMAYVAEPLAEGPYFDLVRPVDDETFVRARAYDHLKANTVLAMEQEIKHVQIVQLADFEAFRDRMLSADASREAAFAAAEDQLRALFEANAVRSPEGAYVFDQPMRVNVLRKA